MSIINNLLDKVSEYIRVRGEKLKLDIITQVSKILAQFIVLSSIALIFLFLIVFLSLALGAYLNSVLDSPHYGYLIVSGIYLIALFGLFVLLRSNKMQNWLEELFINMTDAAEEDE
ncbi:MAG: phage holin family protein [Cyclobacteriaceae bacterium]